MKFYGLKSCDTCRKARKELDAAGIDYDYVDVRADGVAAATLNKWLKEVAPAKLVNRSSTTWRGLSDDEKAAADNPASLVPLLQTNPTLIKRPVIEAGEAILVGWKDDVRSRLL